MKNINLIILTILCLTTFNACSQSNKPSESNKVEQSMKNLFKKTQAQHDYGGWYCPDNLRGFPAVDIDNWKDVPVVNGRMATKEETEDGTSLIFVDVEKYPNAKPLDMKMPRLAKFFNPVSNKSEIVIVIQAISVSDEPIVGFRYLNGGNGSSRLDEVKFLSDSDIDKITSARFVTLSIKINTLGDEVWNVLTNPEYSQYLQPIFDKKNTLKSDWNKTSKVNFKYLNESILTSEFAGKLYGNKYIQLDWESDDYQYVEKFLISDNLRTKTTHLQIACGPYGDDYETQKNILNAWATKVKVLSERNTIIK